MHTKQGLHLVSLGTYHNKSTLGRSGCISHTKWRPFVLRRLSVTNKSCVLDGLLFVWSSANIQQTHWVLGNFRNHQVNQRSHPILEVDKYLSRFPYLTFDFWCRSAAYHPSLVQTTRVSRIPRWLVRFLWLCAASTLQPLSVPLFLDHHGMSGTWTAWCWGCHRYVILLFRSLWVLPSTWSHGFGAFYEFRHGTSHRQLKRCCPLSSFSHLVSYEPRHYRRDEDWWHLYPERLTVVFWTQLYPVVYDLPSYLGYLFFFSNTE